MRRVGGHHKRMYRAIREHYPWRRYNRARSQHEQDSHHAHYQVRVSRVVT